MMGCTAIAWPEIGIKPSSLLDAVGLPSETDHAPKQLSGSANDVMRAAVSVMDDLVLSAIEKRTVEDFVKVRDKVFPEYLSALFAFGMLMSVAVREDARERLIAESLSELESDFRDDGKPIFGEDLRNRGLFTVWTLRKIVELNDELRRKAATQTIDEDNAKKFVVSAVYARFHVDCLVKSIRNKKPIFPPLVEPIADGLRAAVNAYAHMRQVVDAGATEPELAPVELDAEDDAWLSDSMRDLDRQHDWNRQV
jgi:hypothetical protein